MNRIAFLAHNISVAGGLVVAKGLLLALGRKLGRAMVVWLPDQGGYPIEQLEQMGVEVHVMRDVRSFYKRLAYEKNFIRPRCASGDIGWLVGLGNNGLTKPPCRQAVFCQNAFYCYQKKGHYPAISITQELILRVQRYYMRRYLKYSDALFVQTNVMRDRMKSVFDFHNVTVVLPTPAQKVSRVSKINKPSRRLRLIYLAKCYSFGHKNHSYLLSVFEVLRRRGRLSDVTLDLSILPNENAHARRLHAAVQDKGLEANIRFIGPIAYEDLPASYATYDAICMPSTLESLSSTYLEAMSYGLPILALDMDFARTVCGEGALYARPENPEDMANDILLLFDDIEKRKRLIELGYEQLSVFPDSWSDVADSVLNTLRAN